MNRTILGTCSVCGGPVTVPTVQFSMTPPTLTCDDCGSTQAKHGPVIDMMPGPAWVMVKPVQWWPDSDDDE